MPQFRLTLAWDDEYFDRDAAKEDLQQIWSEIEDLADKQNTLQVFDVQVLPRNAGGTTEVVPLQHGDQAKLASMIGEMNVVHPWDQGSNIFPDEHPLAPYERIARDRDDRRAGDALLELPSGELHATDE